MPVERAAAREEVIARLLDRLEDVEPSMRYSAAKALGALSPLGSSDSPFVIVADRIVRKKDPLLALVVASWHRQGLRFLKFNGTWVVRRPAPYTMRRAANS